MTYIEFLQQRAFSEGYVQRMFDEKEETENPNGSKLGKRLMIGGTGLAVASIPTSICGDWIQSCAVKDLHLEEQAKKLHRAQNVVNRYYQNLLDKNSTKPPKEILENWGKTRDKILNAYKKSCRKNDGTIKLGKFIERNGSLMLPSGIATLGTGIYLNHKAKKKEKEI